MNTLVEDIPTAIFVVKEEEFVPVDFIKHEIEDTIEEEITADNLPPRRNVEPPPPSVEYVCLECGEIFPIQIALTAHVHNIHQNIKNSFACSQCPRKLTTRWGLKNHVNVVHEKLKQHTCDECTYASGYRAQLHRHLYKVHKHPFNCSICPYTAIKKNILARHCLVEHSERRPKTHVCSHCSARFASKHSLNNHFRNIHPPLKNLRCKDCPYYCLGEAILKHHRDNVHDTIKCTKCKYRCATKVQLDEHRCELERGNLKFKIFICTSCTFASLTEINMELHMGQGH